MEWGRGPTIGRGATSTVSLATCLRSGEVFAVKSCELSASTLLQREKDLLAGLSHNNPHIVKYIGFDSSVENSKPMYNIFMEYVPGGTLHEVIRHHGGKLKESLMKLYTRQILLGLDYMHSNGVAHCDVKSQNVLIGENGKVAKICDFGCARIVGQNSPNTTSFSGTPMFMSPEVVRGEKQGFEVDIWALGCTFIEMARGNQPIWQEVNDPVRALYKIGFSNELPQIPSYLSDKAKDFASKCLVRDPKERWRAQDLLDHPFFDDLRTNYEQVQDMLALMTMNTASPSCVLDSGFWDSVESTQGSARQRIMSLVDDHAPIWSDFEQNWVTIRSIGNFLEDIEILVNQTSLGTTNNVSNVYLGSDFVFESLENSENVVINRGKYQFVSDQNPNVMLNVEGNKNLLFNSISNFTLF